MKTFRFFVLLSACTVLLLSAGSCSVFKHSNGCPSNGKNVGAEKLLSGDKVPKARKFKS